MIDKVKSVFSEPGRHISTSEIIRMHSSNRDDVREVALKGIDLNFVKDVLDLGCGFGFMAQCVSKYIPAEACITGIDACGENEAEFVATVTKAGKNAKFLYHQIMDKLSWEDKTFDVVLATYSLYFFPDIIPEICRILKPDGLFIAITHFSDSFSGLYKAAKFSENNTPLSKLIDKFSAENGREKLEKYFTEIERIDYINVLQFEKKDVNNLLEYFKFKLPFMALGQDIRDHDTSVYLPDKLKFVISETLITEGKIEIKKSDAIFRCRGPKKQ